MFKAGIFLNLKKMFTVTKDKTELVQRCSIFLDSSYLNQTVTSYSPNKIDIFCNKCKSELTNGLGSLLFVITPYILMDITICSNVLDYSNGLVALLHNCRRSEINRIII
jgi:hypothetical protein